MLDPLPSAPGSPGADGTSDQAQSVENARVLAGRYRLDAVIGKGSMGTVWAATDQVLHRRVAIKEIDFPVGMPRAERADLEARTMREARAIAALSNPFVITLFDILTLPGGPVIVMELLHARSLSTILKKVGRLPDGQAATVGVAVASGLMAAHNAGITHRDVKPGNVLICDDGRIKLTDFGIARSSAEQTMTATGLLLGSPAYIAPEVASGVPTGPASDAWSLGGLLFATVEGRPPFDQGSAIATLTSVVKDPVPPHPHSGRLAPVVSGLLVKTPGLRMRIERALTIMRGIADDPSGTHLSTVVRIQRSADDTGGVGYLAAPPVQTGGRGATGAGPTSSPVTPHRTPPTSPPHALSDDGPTAAQDAPRPAMKTESPVAPADSHPPPATETASTGQTPSEQTGATSQAPGAGRVGTPSRVASTSGAAGIRPPPGRPARTPDLPPPPWAGHDTAALRPLPAEAAATDPDREANAPSQRRRLMLAILVAIIAAVAGFFGVRAIADLASTSAAGAAPGVAVWPAARSLATSGATSGLDGADWSLS